MIQVTDHSGKVHSVYAAKPKSANPGDAYLNIVLHKGTSTGFPYVLHDMNLQTSGCHNGRYFQTFEEGLEAFSKAN